MKRSLFTLSIATLLILGVLLVPHAHVLAQTAANTSNGTTATQNSGASLLSVFNILNPLTWINTAMEIVILPLASFILFLSGLLLDFAINFSLNISNLVNQSGQTIYLGWTIIRDVFNISFIFIIIYSAIMIMLDVSSWNGKKVITNVIIAAVIINFSFFFTEILIDMGNILGGWFYRGILNVLNQGGTVSGTTSLSAALSGMLGVWNLNIASSDSWKLLGNSLLAGFTDPTTRVIAAFIRLSVISLAAYVFAYSAIMFLGRAISLMFSLIFSPIGFAGSLLPGTEDYAKDWRKELTKDLMLAPVFLLLLYIIIAFANSPIMQGIGTTSASILSPGSSLQAMMGQYLKYFLLIGMLLSALSVTKKFSSHIGEMAEGLAKKLGNVAVGAATGGAGLIGQFTLGAAASRLSNNRSLNEMVAGGGIKGLVAGAAQKRLTGVADYHFNPAGAAISDAIGFKTGKGYSALMKDNDERQKKAQEKIAVTPKDTAPAKAELSAAEDKAYAKYEDQDGSKVLGTKYTEAKQAMENAEKAFKADPRNKDRSKEYNDAKKDFNNIKTLIDNDPAFKLKEKIFNEQKNLLKDIDEQLKVARKNGVMEDIKGPDGKTVTEGAKTLDKKREAVNRAMSQERAAQAAEKGPAVTAAKAFAGEEQELGKTGLVKKFVGKNAAATIANVFTLGISKAASKAFLADNGKTVKNLREVADKGKKKQKEQDLTKLFASLADEAESIPAPTPPTPPAPTP